ncbi:molybdopterin molybdotransferase MoeA [Streptomyces sp. LNU-CPARS28]|uniref:molybdopterin molybdotransferase MoeA n=1 Tax=Streptomyces sp. LNU-CPARS28 TaxID=3137371 RepID=UPI003136520D
MTGQHAADAEFDEALALVNEDRARTGAGAARPGHASHPDGSGNPAHPAHLDGSGNPAHPDDVEPAHAPGTGSGHAPGTGSAHAPGAHAPDAPGTAPRTPGTRRSAPSTPPTPREATSNTPADPLTPPGGWPPGPGDRPTATGAWPDVSDPPPGPPGARFTNPGDQPTDRGDQPTGRGTHHTAPGTHHTAPGTQPTGPGTQPTGPGTQPAGPGTHPTTPGDQPTAPDAHPKAPNTLATPWPEARTIARRAGASVATPAPRATQTPPATQAPPATPAPPTPQAPPPATSTPLPLPLPQTLGRTLSTPLTALTDLPSFDTSAMDGWAVAGPGPWVVLAEGILAGQGSPEPLGDGEAVRIATGARIPRDTTAVIRSEHGHVDGKGRLHAQREVVPGQDIRPRGQECRAGERLLPSGTLVTPAVLGLAAAAGYDTLYVAARPRVEVLVLGDELLTKGLPQDGLIRDALGPMLPPWVRALGAEVTAVRRLGDDAEALYEALATSTAEVLVTTGGTASGPVDHVHPTLRRLGAELLVDGVAVRPGHPMLLARLPSGEEGAGGADSTGVRHLVGLPGNPLAAVSGLLTLAEPLLRGLASRPAAEPYTAPLRADVHGHPQDTRLVPVVLRGEHAIPLHYNGPAMLRGIAVADGLAVIPPGGARRGRELEILDLPWTEPGVLPGELGIGGPDDEVCFT